MQLARSNYTISQAATNEPVTKQANVPQQILQSKRAKNSINRQEGGLKDIQESDRLLFKRTILEKTNGHESDHEDVDSVTAKMVEPVNDPQDFWKITKTSSATTKFLGNFRDKLNNDNPIQRRRGRRKTKNTEIMILEDDLDDDKCCLVDLDGNFKAVWDLINTFLIFYIMVFLPYKISFVQTQYLWWDMIDYGVDIFFFMDVIISFITPYYKGEKLVISYKLIAINYIFGWFLFDFISIFPIKFFIPENDNLKLIKQLNKVARLYKVLKVIRLFKIFMRKRKQEGLMGFIISLLNTKNVLFNTMFPTFFLVFMITHIFSCIWHYISYFSEDFDTWIDRNQFRDIDNYGRYIASVYFVFQTITTVGYGDIGVKTNTEFSLAIFLMFTGVIFYSMILTKLLEYITKVNEEQDDKELHLNLVKEIHRDIDINPMLLVHVKREIKESSGIEETSRKKEIPTFEGVNKEDVFDLHFEYYRHKFRDCKLMNAMYYFEKKEFIVDFGLNMIEVSFKAGDIIWNKLDTPSYFYVIRSGRSGLILPRFDLTGEDIHFFEFREAFFGETEFINKKKTRQFTCKALTDMQCYAIDAKDFYAVVLGAEPSVTSYFLQTHSERSKKIIDAFKETTILIEDTLDEIEDERLKNPLYRLQRFVKSKKFRLRYLEYINPNREQIEEDPTGLILLLNTNSMFAEMSNLQRYRSSNEFSSRLSALPPKQFGKLWDENNDTCADISPIDFVNFSAAKINLDSH